MKHILQCQNYIVQYHDICRKSRLSSMPDFGIFVHLHYLNTVDVYLKKLDKVLPFVHVYISTDSQEVSNRLEEYARRKKASVQINLKPNRGRDISSLLVTFREEILKYDFFCFLHDKRAKKEHLKDDTDFWTQSLWDNTIHSVEYVKRIIMLFLEDPKLGLLVPPEPVGKFTYYDQYWENNFSSTQELAKQLKLSVSIESDVIPCTYGTVFWGRTSCLERLINRPWKYEDFQDEPLPNNGTLSHAVERILGYLAIDQGTTVGRIMTLEYAEKYLHFFQEAYMSVFHFVDQEYGLKRLNDVVNYKSRENRVVKFFKGNSHVYLYGAGEVGRQCLAILERNGMFPDAFVVTKKNLQLNSVMEIPIIELSEVVSEAGIVITVSYDLIYEVEEKLKKAGIENYIIFYGETC